jgi:hypothetical protein
MILRCVSKGAREFEFMQERKFAKLCTCCEDVVPVVDEGGKDGLAKSNRALLDRTAEGGYPHWVSLATSH